MNCEYVSRYFEVSNLFILRLGTLRACLLAGRRSLQPPAKIFAPGLHHCSSPGQAENGDWSQCQAKQFSSTSSLSVRKTGPLYQHQIGSLHDVFDPDA